MATVTQPMTLDEYLEFDDGTDTRYELIDGEPVAVTAESDLNDCIASFLYAYFLKVGVPYSILRTELRD